MYKKCFAGMLVAMVLGIQGYSQNVLSDTIKAGKFDNGKMWTFDFPPLDYFDKTYGFKPTQQWMDDVRMSALRFANYCSASFVSADGLVMTNHHCARESGIAVQKPGEDFNRNGFTAMKLEDERIVPDLYVEQLVKIEDITARVQKALDNGKSDEEKVKLKTQEFDAIKKEYKEKTEWKDLELQTITFYWGGKYSLYGFKRYTDVRLVVFPELALGFFGGDFDNFTYPRYCLDFSFFRVYDNGKPLKTEHYFKFNPEGAAEGDPVFVVGNPGSTNRQATTAILEYLRDFTWPTITQRLADRSHILSDYNSIAKSDSLANEIFSFENSIKAITGMLNGLKDPYIMGRRNAFERDFKTQVTQKPKLKSQTSLWNDIASVQNEIKSIYFDLALMTPNGLNSDAFDLGTLFYMYATTENAAQKEQVKHAIADYKKPLSVDVEKKFLAKHFEEALKYKGADDAYVKQFKGSNAKEGMALEYPKKVNVEDPLQLAGGIIDNSKIYDAKFRNELLEKGPEAILASKDPALILGRMSGKRYMDASSKNKQLSARLSNLRAQLGLLLFEVYGTSIPPDATFSLRIADGVVKGYNYNGTKAPYKTTFFGLYDRYYSFDKDLKKDPWDLPEKWKNPPMELLSAPVDFVSTNDIIGGNSGSPMINKNKEVVGLIFDGNMESLPGNYIYIPESNRTVSVHAGGIVAGLKYIYKVDRIVQELLGK